MHVLLPILSKKILAQKLLTMLNLVCVYIFDISFCCLIASGPGEAINALFGVMFMWCNK